MLNGTFTVPIYPMYIHWIKLLLI